jgi:hypothetical protein
MLQRLANWMKGSAVNVRMIAIHTLKEALAP